MKLREYLQKKEAFADSILPILNTINFKRDGNMEEEVKQFFQEGYFYDIRVWTYNKSGDVELRLDRCNAENFNVRYHLTTLESCYVFTDPFSRRKLKETKSDTSRGNYFIQYYQIIEADANKCFYCNRVFRFKCVKLSNHNKTKQHKENQRKVIDSLVSASRLNSDVIQNILSYLY